MPFSKAAAAALLLFAACTLPASANTILNTGVGVSGGPSINASQYEEQGWTQTASYTNVNISVALYSWTPGQTFDIQAYLTSSVGASTSSSIATTTLSSSTPDATPVTYLLFSGLTLPAGSYYVTLASTDSTGGAPGAIWPAECASGCPLAEDTGVALLSPGFANTSAGTQNSLFPPGSTFVTASSPTNLTVTGDSTAPSLPEPDSMTMAATAFGALAFLRRKR